MTTETSSVNSGNSSIPVEGTDEQRVNTAKSILHAFQTAGFFYLTNHTVPLHYVSRTFDASAYLFGLPQKDKDKLRWTTPESNRGYVSHGREKVSTLVDKSDVAALRAQAPDLKESFEIGREEDEGMANRWPGYGGAVADRFRDLMLDFHVTCKEMHIRVMEAIAVGMGLDPQYFDPYTFGGYNTLRLLHYPEVPKSIFTENKLQVRAGEHTDYGSITLLFQDNRGGLQVKSPNGTFVDVIPIEGAVVVNAGDLLARWSNDTIKSTLHRVVEPPAPEEGDVHPARYSIAYFCNPDFDKTIKAIDGTYGGVLGDRKYEDINSGEYLVQRLTATY